MKTIAIPIDFDSFRVRTCTLDCYIAVHRNWKTLNKSGWWDDT